MNYLTIKSVSGYCIILVINIFLGLTLSAQTTYKYTYTYNESGNRITRLSEIEIGGSKNAELNEDGQIEENNSSNIYRESIAGYGLKFYPNPTDGQLVVEIESLDSETTGNIKVIDINGRLIYTTNTLEPLNHISLIDQPEGSYILQIQINEDSRSYRIIKK